MSFSGALLEWASVHGRQGLPWQPSPDRPADPYRVWLSEVMLQQTQLVSMRPYYERFIARFPSLADLAEAPLDDVLAAWSGLGYYARARNLHRAAQIMQMEGVPREASAWARLPGVGESTAAAITSVVYGERVAILDGNVRRVLARQVAADEPWGSAGLSRRLWPEARARLPAHGAEMPAYTQAIMDLGALVCLPRRPLCEACPVQTSCEALRRGEVEDYPRPAIKKARPIREQDWLLIRSQGQASPDSKHHWADWSYWALVRRPPSGIWGGLLALPAASDRPVSSAALGLDSFGQIQHDFTHFRLVARIWSRPWLSRDPQADQSSASWPSRLHQLIHALQPALAEVWSEDAELVWLRPKEALEAGIPTPLRRLLLSLDSLD